MRICRLVNFAVPADNRIKIKENEKRDIYLDLARQLKKLWDLKVLVIPVVIGTLGTVPKDLVMEMEELEIGEQIRTIQTSALLRSARRALETWGYLL